jgi:cell division protein FtsB
MDIWQKIMFSASAIIILTLFGFIIFNDKGLLDRAEMKKERNKISSRKAAVIAENSKMFQEIDRLQNDVHYIERVARHTLGMIADDEFVVKYH